MVPSKHYVSISLIKYIQIQSPSAYRGSAYRTKTKAQVEEGKSWRTDSTIPDGKTLGVESELPHGMAGAMGHPGRD